MILLWTVLLVWHYKRLPVPETASTCLSRLTTVYCERSRSWLRGAEVYGGLWLYSGVAVKWYFQAKNWLSKKLKCLKTKRKLSAWKLSEKMRYWARTMDKMKREIEFVTACLEGRNSQDHRSLPVKWLHKRLRHGHTLCERTKEKCSQAFWCMTTCLNVSQTPTTHLTLWQKCSHTCIGRLLLTRTASEATIDYALKKTREAGVLWNIQCVFA